MSIWWGKGENFKRLRKISYESFNVLIECVEENDLFRFLMLFNNFMYNYDTLAPEFQFPPRGHGLWMRGTIFEYGSGFYLDPLYLFKSSILFRNRHTRIGMMLLMQLSRDINSRNPRDIVVAAKRLSFGQIKKYINGVKAKAMHTIGILVKRNRSENPVKVDVRKGVLFLTGKWYRDQRNKKIFERLVKRGVPVLVGFTADVNDAIDPNQVLATIHELIGVEDLGSFQGAGHDESYFYLEGGKLIYNNKGEPRVIY